METKLTEIIEALLFSTSQPVSIKDVQAVFSRAASAGADSRQGVFGSLVDQVPIKVPAAGRIREAMESLRGRFDERGDVCQLVEVAGGWELVLREKYAPWIRFFREEPTPKKPPMSVVETLAVVAYRQPVSRAEIEAVRGVGCERSIAKLVEMDLIRAVGRAELPGRPIQYATTRHFLEACGLASLDELPASDVISPELLDRWLSGGEGEKA
jgi:segregation and condensation protein B